MAIERRIAVALAVAVALPLGLLIASPASAVTDLDLEAHLHGTSAYPNARGWAEYERESDGSRELDVRVSHILALAGTRVVVYASGSRVGSMIVRDSGVAQRSWDTDRGQFVPRVHVGDGITVRTPDGVRVARGTFVVETD